MEIAAFAMSIVAVLVAGGAVWYARGQKVAADRAADAAEATLELARAAERRVLEDAERDQVDWELERTSQQVFVLWNRGSGSAYAVRVDLADLGVGDDNRVYFEEFGGRIAEQYYLARGLGSTTMSLTVTWHQSPDAQDEAKQQALPVLF